MAKRILYAGVATEVHEVTEQGRERMLLYIIVDPDSGDQIEVLLDEDTARRDGRRLAAPPGRLEPS